MPKLISFVCQQRPFAVPFLGFPQLYRLSPVDHFRCRDVLMKSHLRTIFTTQKHFIDCTLRTSGWRSSPVPPRKPKHSYATLAGTVPHRTVPPIFFFSRLLRVWAGCVYWLSFLKLSFFWLLDHHSPSKSCFNFWGSFQATAEFCSFSERQFSPQGFIQMYANVARKIKVTLLIFCFLSVAVGWITHLATASENSLFSGILLAPRG